MAEQLANDLTAPDEPTATLQSAITAGATSLSVASGDGANFPAVGNFRIRIENEILIVTARATDTLTVTRGAESTVAATHNGGVGVNLVLTAGALNTKFDDLIQDTADLNDEVNELQERATERGTLAARPAFGNNGKLYINNDDGIVDFDTGAAWDSVIPLIAAGVGNLATGRTGGERYDSTQRRKASWDGFVVGSLQRALNVPQPNATDTLSAATISTTETAFASTFVLPANYLIARKLLRISALFSLTTSGVPPTLVITLRVQKSGPTNVNLWRNVAVTPPINLTGAGYGFEWILSSADAVGAAAGIEAGSVLGMLFGTAVYNTIAQRVSTDTASEQTIQITVTYGANTAGNSITLRHGPIVEEMR